MSSSGGVSVTGTSVGVVGCVPASPDVCCSSVVIGSIGSTGSGSGGGSGVTTGSSSYSNGSTSTSKSRGVSGVSSTSIKMSRISEETSLVSVGSKRGLLSEEVGGGINS